ncbi:VOC family protein [Streptomyces sp. NPDC003077]|uniref:VOC family protein n=1 Tax=Streptomyces sp. NPDC003077 TaxID=3154443 RepID=UPI0033A8B901
MPLTAKMITMDCAEPRALADWWATALETEVAGDHGDFVTVATGSLTLAFQRVPEKKQGKNRVHVDFCGDDRGQEVARLVRLGATAIGDHTMAGTSWTVLRDPDGNEFCVSD